MIYDIAGRVGVKDFVAEASLREQLLGRLPALGVKDISMGETWIEFCGSRLHTPTRFLAGVTYGRIWITTEAEESVIAYQLSLYEFRFLASLGQS
ncbi:MAG TPA: hypothetical protein VJH03_23300 [Blastocatellia bacterium]|nr:hypothetical protein [Blastocatellia bacterium]